MLLQTTSEPKMGVGGTGGIACAILVNKTKSEVKIKVRIQSPVSIGHYRYVNKNKVRKSIAEFITLPNEYVFKVLTMFNLVLENMRINSNGEGET